MCWTFEEHDYFVSPKRIRSIADYLACITCNWRDWFKRSKSQWSPQEELPWFRGVHNEEFELIPGIYRGHDVLGWKYDDHSHDAEDMKAEFARRAIPFLEGRHSFRDGEYMQLMQHYRFPTRLLDWTEGALIALYFAVRCFRTIRPESYKPCVWMLNPSWLNYVNDKTVDHPGTNESKSLVLYTDHRAMERYGPDHVVFKYYLETEHRLGNFPVAVFPSYIDRRIVAQKSVFTIHGRKKNGFKDLAKKTRDSQLAKVLITSDPGETKQIIEDMRIMGITETTLFPDLEGLSRELQAEYGMKVAYP